MSGSKAWTCTLNLENLFNIWWNTDIKMSTNLPKINENMMISLYIHIFYWPINMSTNHTYKNIFEKTTMCHNWYITIFGQKRMMIISTYQYFALKGAFNSSEISTRWPIQYSKQAYCTRRYTTPPAATLITKKLDRIFLSKWLLRSWGYCSPLRNTSSPFYMV